MTITAPRVLHLFANYKWTGPADPAIRTAARLRARGVDVVFAQGSFVHPGGEHRVAAELWRARVPVVAGLELRKHFHWTSLRRDVAALRTLLVRDRIDVVHCHQGADHLLAALAVRRVAAPPVIVRSLYEPDAPARGLRARVAFRRTAAVVAPTAAARAGTIAAFGVPATRVVLQAPVTEPRRLDGPNARVRFGLTAAHRVVGITARIQPHRRFDLLWATARHVVDRLPHVRFVLLGRGNADDTRTLVTAPITRLGLGSHVVLPGYQQGDAYDEALRALDALLFLVPGSDGTCRAVCDAMAFGAPVVCTRAGMLPELVAPDAAGDAPGEVCDDRPAALGDALLRLLTEPDRHTRARRVALHRARVDMDPQRAAARLEALYAELLASRRAGAAP